MQQPPAGIDFNNKLILGPMVRVNQLPFRLCALKWGADIVYTEELVDHKLLQCRRVVSDMGSEGQLVEFISNIDNIGVFRTCSKEHPLVLQLGTSDPARAVAAARLVNEDVDGIDVNFGCPMRFSIQGGMGAALACQPELARKILIELSSSISKPITCKIRLLNNVADTVTFIRDSILGTGVSAITIHARHPNENSLAPPRWKELREVVNALQELTSDTPQHLPVLIANGGLYRHADVQSCREATGLNSFMLARGALADPINIFCKHFCLPSASIQSERDECVRDFLCMFRGWGGNPARAKHVVMQILQQHRVRQCWNLELFRKVQTSRSELWNVETPDVCSSEAGVNPEGQSLAKRLKTDSKSIPM